MTAIRFHYGDTLLSFEIPDRLVGEILSPKAVAGEKEPEAIIASTLDAPIGTPPLEDMVELGQSVAVIIDDITRATPTRLMLPPLLARLRRAGVAHGNIRIVIALGSHRPMTAEEITFKVGEAVAKDYEIVNVPSWDESRQVYKGISSTGIPAWVNRTVAEADLRIGIGMITPHADAGYSGGAKIILPGVCGNKTVDAFHSRQVKLFDSQLGVSDAPMRLDLELFVKERIGLDFILNAIIDHDGRLYDCVAGDFVAAHRRGVDTAREVYGVRAAKRYPLVIVNAFPNDIDWWQSVKGLSSGELLTEEGGTLILVTRCPEGNNTHPLYAEYIGTDPEQLLAQLESGQPEDPVACALAVPVARLNKRLRVAVVSEGLQRDDAERMGFDYYPSMAAALPEELKGSSDRSVGILTHGGTSMPVF